MNSIQEAIKDLRAGKMVILVDDVRRENEGGYCGETGKQSTG